MYIHILFIILYLAALGRSVDRYHAVLKKIADLKSVLDFPDVMKERVYADLTAANEKMKQVKKNALRRILLVFAAHFLVAAILSMFFYLSRFNLDRGQIYYPVYAILPTLPIWVAILWLKGKGGGIPNINLPENFG